MQAVIQYIPRDIRQNSPRQIVSAAGDGAAAVAAAQGFLLQDQTSSR